MYSFQMSICYWKNNNKVANLIFLMKSPISPDIHQIMPKSEFHVDSETLIDEYSLDT